MGQVDRLQAAQGWKLEKKKFFYYHIIWENKRLNLYLVSLELRERVVRQPQGLEAVVAVKGLGIQRGLEELENE